VVDDVENPACPAPPGERDADPLAESDGGPLGNPVVERAVEVGRGEVDRDPGVRAQLL
jgi:hypothetical protein